MSHKVNVHAVSANSEPLTKNTDRVSSCVNVGIKNIKLTSNLEFMPDSVEKIETHDVKRVFRQIDKHGYGIFNLLS